MKITFYPDILINIALKILPRMLVPEKNMFCTEITKTNTYPLYDSIKSPRYTIICLLGLTRAKIAGYDISIDIERIYRELLKYMNTLTIGDLGLMLWLDQRFGSNNSAEILQRIKKLLNSSNWHKIIGGELAWLIAGLTAHSFHNGGEDDDLEDSIISYILANRFAPSGLFYHTGKGMRRRFPNFATQVYSIYALSLRSRLRCDKECGNRAVQAAECLAKLQLNSGAWPWLYNANLGEIVEPLEVYSVHQDAMAPMAFHELFRATGFDSAEIINRSLNWLNKGNELGVNMIDYDNGLIYRSIRRKKPMNRLSLYEHTFFNLIGISLNPKVPKSSLEVNLTCRPYHLGWILEAWCERSM